MKIFYIHHPLQLDSHTFTRFLQQIPFELQQKIKRYRRWKDQQAGLWGKLLLMKSLEEMGLDKNGLQHLQYTSYQRPYFPKELGFGIDFNISHSGFAVACVVSSKQRIGIDIEQIRPIEIKHFTEQFSPMEMQQMHESENTQRAFFERWCQKEAIIKVDGRGLSIPLPQVKIEGLEAKIKSQTFYLKAWDSVENHVSYLASDEPIEGIEVKKLTLQDLLF